MYRIYRVIINDLYTSEVYSKLCATMKFVEHKQKLLKVFIVTYLISV